jgi:hypothetical protein
MATKKQTKSIFGLFNKVYGFAEGLSRREEQQKRYQKKIKDMKNRGKQTEKKDGKEKNMLNELFDVGGFMNDNSSGMVDKYMAHLIKVLISREGKFINERYNHWKNWG